MVDKIACALLKPGVLEPGMRVLCAVSGGPDSMALLHALGSLAADLHFTLCVGHVEHGIRKGRSKKDAAFVREHCQRADIPFFQRCVDAPALAAEQRLSLEDAARRARYEALFDMAEEAGADRIALAHHMDDQAETVLLHLFRGSAMSGFCGMRFFREDGVIRPMLGVRRAQVLAYCRERGIEYSMDETNTDTRHTRNGVRLKVMPAVEDLFPGAVNSIARTALILQDEEAFMRACAQEAAKACEDAAGALRAGELLSRPVALTRRVALDWLKRHGDAARVEACHVEALLKLCAAGTGAALDVPGGRARNNYGMIAWENPSSVGADERELEIPGVTPVGDAWIRATVLDTLPDDLTGHPAVYDYFDFDVFPKKAAVRRRRTGDSFRPLGMRGTQKLKAFFINRRVPRAERDKVPVCALGSRVLWIAGMGLEDALRVRPGITKRVLKLEIMGEGGEGCDANGQG